MLKPSGERDLALEPRDRHAPRQLGRQHLHDDAPAERGVLGDEHARHARPAELALDRVGVAERGLELVAKISHTESQS